MSANNWTYCPQCKKNRATEHATERRAATESYGKVPADEYAKLIAKVDDLPELEETMREDYELGVDDDGTFSISYRAACEHCDFVFKFKHEDKLILK